MKSGKWLLVWMLLAMPAFAAEGVPGATIANGANPPYGGAQREACRANPEKCRQERMAQREEMCAQDPQKCAQMKAKMEQRRAACKADPEKCRLQREARTADRFKKADADGNGSLSRAQADKGMPRLARRFDGMDANKDGQLSQEELNAARKAHHGKAPGKF